MNENNQIGLIPTNFEQCWQFANTLAEANLIPSHLKKSPADCMRVVLQAVEWRMNPFAVADKTSVISGKLMYEGQLVSAVINSRGNLKKKLDYTFSGSGNSRSLVVFGTLSGEDNPREITLTFEQACSINKNGQMQKNPDQQMCYIGARIWARRYMSELMLGVYTPDEFPAESDTATVRTTYGKVVDTDNNTRLIENAKPYNLSPKPEILPIPVNSEIDEITQIIDYLKTVDAPNFNAEYSKYSLGNYSQKEKEKLTDFALNVRNINPILVRLLDTGFSEEQFCTIYSDQMGKRIKKISALTTDEQKTVLENWSDLAL